MPTFLDTSYRRVETTYVSGEDWSWDKAVSHSVMTMSSATMASQKFIRNIYHYNHLKLAKFPQAASTEMQIMD